MIIAFLMKNFGFIELNDGSCFKSLQVVFGRESLSNYEEIARQNVGAALIIKGKLLLTPEAKQPFDTIGNNLNVRCRQREIIHQPVIDARAENQNAKSRDQHHDKDKCVEDGKRPHADISARFLDGIRRRQSQHNRINSGRRRPQRCDS